MFPHTNVFKKSLVTRSIKYAQKFDGYEGLAETFHEFALLLEPTKENYLSVGKWYYSRNSFENAITCFSECIRINKNDCESYKLRGIAHYKIKKLVESKQDFHNANKIDNSAKELLIRYFPNDTIRAINNDSKQTTQVQTTEKHKIQAAPPAISEKPKVTVLQQYNIECLYHLTHRDNLKGILENGLQSHTTAHLEKLVIKDISDQEVNARRSKKETIYSRSIHDYAPLYIKIKNPMLYVRQNAQNELAILIWDSNLMYQENIIFTDGNAASDGTKFYSDLKDLDKLYWDCLNSKWWTEYSDGRRKRCAEVLVFPSLDIKYLRKICCKNEASKRYLEKEISQYDHIPIEVNSELFFN